MIDSLHYNFLNRLARLEFIDEIWLFGSRARGDNVERSDIDLAIICPNATDRQWSQVMKIIDEADTLLKIDCIRFDQLCIDDPIRDNILKYKKVLYQKNGSFMDKILWSNSFYALGRAIARLEELLIHKDIDNIEYMQEALIQRFEFTIELYWKILKKVLAYEKVEATTPKDVLRRAFEFNLIDDEAIWLDALDDRNNTSHIYEREQAKKVFENIKRYYPVFSTTYQKLAQRLGL